MQKSFLRKYLLLSQVFILLLSVNVHAMEVARDNNQSSIVVNNTPTYAIARLNDETIQKLAKHYELRMKFDRLVEAGFMAAPFIQFYLFFSSLRTSSDHNVPQPVSSAPNLGQESWKAWFAKLWILQTWKNWGIQAGTTLCTFDTWKNLSIGIGSILAHGALQGMAAHGTSVLARITSHPHTLAWFAHKKIPFAQDIQEIKLSIHFLVCSSSLDTKEEDIFNTALTGATNSLIHNMEKMIAFMCYKAKHLTEKKAVEALTIARYLGTITNQFCDQFESLRAQQCVSDDVYNNLLDSFQARVESQCMHFNRLDGE